MNLKEDCFKANCWKGEVCLNGDDGTEALFIDENTARRCLRIVRCSIFSIWYRNAIDEIEKAAGRVIDGMLD